MKLYEKILRSARPKGDIYPRVCVEVDGPTDTVASVKLQGTKNTAMVTLPSTLAIEAAVAVAMRINQQKDDADDLCRLIQSVQEAAKLDICSLLTTGQLRTPTKEENADPHTAHADN